MGLKHCFSFPRSKRMDRTFPGTRKVDRTFPRTREMDHTIHTCISLDSVFENLTEKSELGYYPEWIPSRMGLGFIKTFLTFIPKWRDADEGVREHLGDLVSSIESAFGKVGKDIEDTVEKREPKCLDAVRLNLEEKVDLFMPRIREAYEFLSEYAFQAPYSPPITDHDVWYRLSSCLITNAWDLRSVNRLGTLQIQFSSILFALQPFIERYVNLMDDCDQFRDLGTQLGGVSICLARLLFLCWVDEADENMTIMFSDLLLRVKPSTPQLLGLYFEAMKSHPFFSQEHFVQELAGIILLPSKEPPETLRDGLAFLISHLLESPRKHAEDVELMRSDIEKVIRDAASLHCFLSKYHDEDEVALFQFLRKIELLKIEILIMKAGDSSISESKIESIYKGVRFLQTFPKCPLDEHSGKLMLVFKRIEEVAKEAESLRHSLHAIQVKEGKLCHTLQVKLLLDFKLTLIQAFLMEPMRCNPSLMVHVKDQIETLYEGSEFFHKYFSILQLDNPSYMEVILNYMEEAVEEATPLQYICRSSQVMEHTIKELSRLLSKLLEKVNLLNAEIKGAYLQFRSSSMLTLPKTQQGLGFVDFFSKNLSALMKYKADSIGYSMKHHIEAVLKELDFLRSFLEDAGEKEHENSELRDFCRLVTRAAYQADYVIDWILLMNADGCHMLWLSDLIDEMKVIKAELIKTIKMNTDSSEVRNFVQTSGHVITRNGTPEVGEVVVSLEDQEGIIIHQLTRGSSRRRVVTIVGMPGIGKTTLAEKVYNNPLVKNLFQSRAWCCVSQVYRKRELLLRILDDIAETTDEIHNKSDQDLVEMLYKRLKRKRYLVVMDDIWSIQAWEELGSAFPDDLNGSRILFTSRYEKVGLEAQIDCAPHSLRFLTEEESWKLLQEKVFHGYGCPEELLEVGQVIAKCCKGLPLAVVAIAGLLRRTDKKADWKQIEKDLNSRILEDPENQCMHILELSFSHLPDYLKPCFLYFAAFGEDNEIPVKKLIQLWIAEGFVRKVDQNSSVEDVAEGYLMDLISRSLIMAARKGSSGGVKACKVHDLLHNLCLKKVKEESFLQSITGYEELFPSSTSRLDYGVDLECPLNSVTYEQYRLSISSKRKHFVMLKPSGPPVRTLLFFATSDTHPRCPYDVSFISHNFKLVRVLDIESINMGSSFPRGIELLYPLRYLAVSGDIDSVPSAIAQLWDLETLIVKGLRGKVALPGSIWRMLSLRHLHVYPSATFSLPDESLEDSCALENLVTLSSPSFSHGAITEEIIRKFPKLLKLRCTFAEPAQHFGNCISFPLLDFLMELESLKIFYYGRMNHFCELSFPLNVHKLSLSDFSLTWDCISTIGALPKLEVLKLVSIAFDSPTWEMRDEEFRELRFLKLGSLEIVQWIASSDHFPSLERLVLRSCKQLEEVPSSFGDITTLQMIELMWCSASAENSVRGIQAEQLEYGNKGFKAIVNVPDADFR